MMTSENGLMPVSEHFSELYKIIRTGALIVILFSLLLSFFVDDLIKYWLGNLGLDYQLISLSVYSPYDWINICLLYTSPSPRDTEVSRMPSSA